MNADEITQDSLASDAARRLVLMAEIEARLAEVRQIDDRAAAWRVHRLTVLMAKHAERDAKQLEGAAAAAARVGAARQRVVNGAPTHAWLDEVESRHERAERDQESAAS